MGGAKILKKYGQKFWYWAWWEWQNGNDLYYSTWLTEVWKEYDRNKTRKTSQAYSLSQHVWLVKWVCKVTAEVTSPNKQKATSVSFYQKFMLRNLCTLISLRVYNIVSNNPALFSFSVARGPHVVVQSECDRKSKTSVLLAAPHGRVNHKTLVMGFSYRSHA